MSVFRAYEQTALRLLLRSTLAGDVVEDVIAHAVFEQLDETGCGYFLTVRHAALPTRRTVCHSPIVVGRVDDGTCGFVAFVEDGRLTLECHANGDATVPRGFRDRGAPIQVQAQG